MFYSSAPDSGTFFFMMALAYIMGACIAQGGSREKMMGRLAGLGFTLFICIVTAFMINGDTRGYDWSLHLLVSAAAVLAVPVGTSVYLARQAREGAPEKPPMPEWLHNSLAALVVLTPLLLFVFPQTETWKSLKTLIFGH